MWNERTGELYKYDGRQDVRDVGIVLPTHLASDSRMDWARDPYRLWNTAEFSEVNRNSRVAREYMVILPEQMTFEQRRNLVYGFAQSLADRYGNAIDVALHDPRTGRARHHHAHLMATTRRVGFEGLMQKTSAEHYVRTPASQHAPQHESGHVRQFWARSLRQAIREAGLPEQTYDELHGAYGRESSRQYRERLLRNGFDLRRQQREDRRKTLVTHEERQESAKKKWDIRKFKHLQRDVRAERQSQAQRERRQGTAQQDQPRHLRCWLPRWDVREGLLKPWEVESHLRRVGQTPAMVPWSVRENAGPEPQFEPDPELVASRPESRSSDPVDSAEASVERWLAQRNAHTTDHAIRARAVEQWLAGSSSATPRDAAMQQIEKTSERSYGLEMDL